MLMLNLIEGCFLTYQRKPDKNKVVFISKHEIISYSHVIGSTHNSSLRDNNNQVSLTVDFSVVRKFCRSRDRVRIIVKSTVICQTREHYFQTSELSDYRMVICLCKDDLH